MKMIRKTKLKRWMKDIFLLGIILIIALIVLEGVFRVGGLEEVPKYRIEYVKHNFYNPFLIFGPTINEVAELENGDEVYFNSQGFRMKEDLDLKKSLGEYRIFALGSSSTLNLINEKDIHYCGEVKLSNIECVNAANEGFSSAHSLVRLQFDLLSFEPDMITVMHNPNDLMVNFFPSEDGRMNYGNKYLHEKFAPKANFGLMNYLKKEVFSESRALFFLYKNLKKIKQILLYREYYDEEGKLVKNNMRFSSEPIELKYKEVFRDNLRSIAGIGKSQNIKIVLMSHPFLISEERYISEYGLKVYNKDIFYPEFETFVRFFKEYNKVIKEVAEEEGVEFIDMTLLFGQEENDFEGMTHFSVEGIKKFGRIYTKEINEIIQKD